MRRSKSQTAQITHKIFTLRAFQSGMKNNVQAMACATIPIPKLVLLRSRSRHSHNHWSTSAINCGFEMKIRKCMKLHDGLILEDSASAELGYSPNITCKSRSVSETFAAVWSSRKCTVPKKRIFRLEFHFIQCMLIAMQLSIDGLVHKSAMKTVVVFAATLFISLLMSSCNSRI